MHDNYTNLFSSQWSLSAQFHASTPTVRVCQTRNLCQWMNTLDWHCSIRYFLLICRPFLIGNIEYIFNYSLAICIYFLICVSTEKYSHKLEVESCFIWWELLGLQALEVVSQVVLRNCFEDVGGVRLYRSLQQKGRQQAVWTAKDYCQLRKTRYLKLRNLAFFFVWEDASIWTHWNHSFHLYLSYLGPASCFLNFSGGIQ